VSESEITGSDTLRAITPARSTISLIVTRP
jgi:hypothetical protein